MLWLRLGILMTFGCWFTDAIGPQVELPGMGTVEGISIRKSTLFRRNFDSYLGIPFGKPPSGDLRYKASVFADPWTGVLKAKRYGRECPQSCPLGPGERAKSSHSSWKRFHEYFGDYETFAEMDMSRKDIDYEDCLFTHVYTPTRDQNAKFPVMVFFHGGSFHAGSARIYVPDHFMDYDMLLVVPHYRLGSLGFLSMQNDEIPGNAGMLDQVLAIEWVYQYIQYFGGDPNQILIFGESAGAASVSLLALSPLTKGLIKGVIAESGGAFAEWALDRNPKYNAYGTAKEAGCNMTSDETIIECLMTADPCTVLDAQDRWSVSERNKGMTGFGAGCPVVQTTGSRIFLDKEPIQVWEDPEFVPVPSIYGANKHEGTYVLGMMLDDYLMANGLEDDINFMTYDIVRPFFTMFGVNDNGNLVTDAVEYAYIDIDRMGNLTAMSPGLIDFGGSTFLKAPGYESNIRHAKFGNSYQYAYNFFGRLTYPICQAVVSSNLEFPAGVCHGAEVVMLFGVPGSYELMRPDEQLLSNKMVKMWYNFAKYLDPTPPQHPIEGLNVTWLPYDPINQYYLRFDDEITLRSDYKMQEYSIAKDENFGLS